MIPKDARTSAAMSRVRQARTTPEERVADVLRDLGFHYRRNARTLPGKPDFSNQGRGWVINVHGCFWHQHDCKRGTHPQHNAELWEAKFAANKARDERVERELESQGLRVLTVWECETRDREKLAEAIKRHLNNSS